MAGSEQIKADVVIIGGGIIGTCTARELSRYQLEVVLVEAEAEVGWGATKANSGIVHAGFHDKPDSLKAKYCVMGNQLYPQLCQELDVSFRQNGILMVALKAEEAAILAEYQRRGEANGVPGLELLAGERARELEPALALETEAALYAPSGGVVAPFELAAAVMENAEQNGVRLITGRRVQSLACSEKGFRVEIPGGTIDASYVINAAGLQSDAIAGMVGDTSFAIQARKGEEYLFDKSVSHLVRQTLFPVPTPVSKGILVIPTSEGNLMIGPTGDDVEDRDDIRTTNPGWAQIIASAQRMVPALEAGQIIAQFAGVRAASDRGDFIVEMSATAPGLLHLAGIESPGLTAAPAIAKDAVSLLAEYGLHLVPRSDFEPYRRPVVRFHQLTAEEQAGMVADNPGYGRVVCRCETITEAEIVDAIQRGARTIDGVKFRARAGCGRCQGGFCQPLVMELLSRELGVPMEAVSKRGPGTEQLVCETKGLLSGGNSG